MDYLRDCFIVCFGIISWFRGLVYLCSLMFGHSARSGCVVLYLYIDESIMSINGEYSTVLKANQNMIRIADE